MPEIKGKYLTAIEIAATFGVTRQYVGSLFLNNRLPYKVIDGTRRVSIAKCKEYFKPSQKKKSTDIDDTSYNEAERLEKVYKAKRQKLEYEKAKGELIDIHEVKNRIASIAARTRDAMQAIPDRIAPEGAAEVDPHRLAVMLRREIDSALEALADAILLNEDEDTNTDRPDVGESLST